MAKKDNLLTGLSIINAIYVTRFCEVVFFKL